VKSQASFATYSLVKTDKEKIEDMRIIRNDCRLFMTNNQNEISKSEQEKWFNELDNNYLIPFVFYKYFGLTAQEPIGYAIIKNEKDSVWLTGGLISSYRGKGIGKLLFEMIVEKAKKYNKKIMLDVLKTNINAISLYTKIGFVLSSENEKVFIMEYLV
jgi:ribosomal protein S18 acetylase RimI-like enzyme